MLYIICLIISGVFLLVSGVQFIRRAGIYAILLIMPSLNLLLKAISSVVLDGGVYVSELMITTWNVYSAPVYLLLLAVFYMCLSSLSVIYAKSPYVASISGYSAGMMNAIVLVGLLMSGYLLLDLQLSGIPLFSNGVITRFNYWDSYSTLPFANIISNFLTPFSAAIGFSLASSEKNDKHIKYYITIILCFISVRFLLGYKVSGIIDLIMANIIGYVYRKYSISEQIEGPFVRIVKYVTICCLSILTFYIVYKLISGEANSLGEAIEQFIERAFSLSNHLWWAVIEDPNHNAQLFPDNLDELLSPFSGKNEFSLDVGAYGLMKQYAPTSIFLNYYNHGIRFAPCFITTGIFYNGWIITGIFIVVNAALFSFFIKSFLDDARHNRVISFGVLYRIFLVFSSYITSTGTLTTFYRPNVLILLLVYLFVRLFENTIVSIER